MSHVHMLIPAWGLEALIRVFEGCLQWQTGNWQTGRPDLGQNLLGNCDTHITLLVLTTHSAAALVVHVCTEA
jgi:hypothetical protein